MPVNTAPAPRVRHDVSDVLDLLAPNALQVIYGVDAAEHPLVTSLTEDSPLHVQGPRGPLTDALVYALLAQCYALNDAEALRVILLDPRQHLSTLFRSHGQTRLVATTPPAVIQAMHVLQQELERRTELSGAQAPPWLIFVEEDPALARDELTWTAFCALVERGRAVGLHLLLASSPPSDRGGAREALPPFRSRLRLAPGEPDPLGGRFTLEREGAGEDGPQVLVPLTFDTRLLVRLAKAAAR